MTDNEKLRYEYFIETGIVWMDTNDSIELDYLKWLEAKIIYTRCCVNKDLNKHPIKGVNETMQIDTDIEEVQLCGKSNCNRQKLEGNVYCSYHYDINFG